MDGHPAAIPESEPRCQLKGRQTFVLLTLQGRAATDEQAVSIVREVAALASAAGLRVCLYPHFGFYAARVEHALRIAEKAGRENVGIAFNLCHWLRAVDQANIKSRLRQVLPRLMMVSINGADHEGGWDRLIQPLDRGDFDLYCFLNELDSLRYDGPIALQCYQVKGDLEANFTRSMNAWRRLSARVAGS